VHQVGDQTKVHENLSIGNRAFHAGGRTEGRTHRLADIMELIVASHFCDRS